MTRMRGVGLLSSAQRLTGRSHHVHDGGRRSKAEAA